MAAAADKVFVNLNGARQGMFIVPAADTRPDAPVLLCLHGGMPEFFLERRFPTGLEQLFTVVWWEQRGSGLSAPLRPPRTPVTVEQLIEDTLSLARLLQQRFDRPRVYLLAHSGGTFLGLQAVARAPELFHAYVAVAQITDQLESEIRAHRYMLHTADARGDKALAARLRQAPVTRELGATAAYMRVRDVAMHRLGVGTMRSMDSVLRGIVLESLRCRDYTVGEKVRLWAGKARSGASVVWDAMLATDLRQRVPAVALPTYFLHGVHDQTCSYDLARGFLTTLHAPVSGFYSFQHSAHSPMFEEPERFRAIMLEDVLQGATSLADPTDLFTLRSNSPTTHNSATSSYL